MKRRILLTQLLVVLLPTLVGANAKDNRFNQFLGDWTLKDNQWRQRWDGKTTETLTIKNHHTHCSTINTNNSVLCTVSAPELNGHILWSFDPTTNQVHHLSSFGASRTGIGHGKQDKDGNLSLLIRFPSEGNGISRDYRYKWVSKNEYILLSTQYRHGKSTGNFYGGAFIRYEGLR